jgi:hypothetical protein
MERPDFSGHIDGERPPPVIPSSDSADATSMQNLENGVSGCGGFSSSSFIIQPDIYLPSYYPVFEQMMQEIGYIVADFHQSLVNGLTQGRRMSDPDLSDFLLSHNQKEDILRRKIQCTALLASARLGPDRARLLRESFHDIDFLVTKFLSKTNAFELDELLYEVKEQEKFILHHFLLLEASSEAVRSSSIALASAFRKYSGEPLTLKHCTGGFGFAGVDKSLPDSSLNSMPSSNERLLARHQLLLDSSPAAAAQPASSIGQAPLSFDDIGTKSATTLFSSSTGGVTAAAAACDMRPLFQQPVATSKLLHVSLDRHNNSGFGISFRRSGVDVVVAAVAAGSASHR